MQWNVLQHKLSTSEKKLVLSWIYYNIELNILQQTLKTYQWHFMHNHKVNMHRNLIF